MAEFFLFIYSAIVGGKDWEELVAEYELLAHILKSALYSALHSACSHSAAHVLNLLHSVPRWALEVLLGKSPGALTFESLTTSLPHYLTTSLPHYPSTPDCLAAPGDPGAEAEGTAHYSRYTTLLVCLEVRHTTRVPRAPGSTSAASLCSREHNQSIFVLPGAQSSSICAPGNTMRGSTMRGRCFIAP